MPHIRQTVRGAVKTILAASNDIAAASVFANRSRPIGLKSGSGYAVEILIPRERSSRIGNPESGKYQREIEVQLVGYVADLDDDAAAESADALALAIETALESATTLGGAAVDCWLQSTEFALDAAAYSNASFAQTWIVEVTSTLDQMNA